LYSFFAGLTELSQIFIMTLRDAAKKAVKKEEKK